MSTLNRDRYGLVLTTSSREAAQLYAEGVDLLLESSYGAEECLQRAIAMDEDFALAHAALSLLQMVLTSGEAQASAARAQRLVRNATLREQRHVEGISLFVHGQAAQALDIILEVLAQTPRDAVLMRVANRILQLGCSGAGAPDFPQRFHALLHSLAPSYGDDWAFLSHYAFAHHEVGQLDEALELAERSLALRPTNGHAVHSIAHVHFEKGQAVAGGDFLGPWLEGYNSGSQFNVHLSWHQALFELAQGQYTEAIARYENAIRSTVVQRSPASLADSASLMWRMRLYGQRNPNLAVHEISQQAEVAADTDGPAFRDAHAALAFAAQGDHESMRRMVKRLERRAAQGHALTGEITLPLVRGIAEFAAERYGAAIAHLEAVMPQVVRIGGSHAQREVFEDTLVEAYVRGQRHARAVEALRERLDRRDTVRDRFWLARVRAEDGAAEAARTMLGDVARNWRRADPDSSEMNILHTLMGAVSTP